MLRNRSRAVTSPQALMTDHVSLPSPTKNQTTPTSSFLGSPRIFGFLTKKLSDSESVMSPTSILDTKISSNSGKNPFGYDRNQSKFPIPYSHSNTKLDSEGIGLALIDSINDEKNEGKFSKPVSRMVLFGSKLKVQIPTLVPSPISLVESPKSPADFGIKTRDSQFLSPFSSNVPIKDFTRQLSLKEMELSEDYTCVITHGPNPKTTHIFDNCIVESCCGDVKFSENARDRELETSLLIASSMDFCQTCRNNLVDDKDIYMDRDEKAFCNNECCYHQEMLIEGIKNPKLD